MTLAFSTSRLNVYYLTDIHAQALHDYVLRNKAHLAPFEPARTSEYYQLSYTHERISDVIKCREAKKGVGLVFMTKQSNEIIGCINFSCFEYGVFQACYLGYSLDKDYQGQGLMTEALNMAIPYIHNKYGIRRFMANYLPDNIASGRVLEKVGFEKEGYAKSYLKINGEWRDHVLTAYVFDAECNK